MVKAAFGLKPEEKVIRAIDEALELAHVSGHGAPAPAIAQRLFDSEPRLIEAVGRQWILARLTWLIGRRRRARWKEASPPQMVLADPIFQDLPRRIFLRNSRRPKLEHCTLGQIEERIKLVRERQKDDRSLEQLKAVAEILRKWTRQEKGISWGEAQRREAEERASFAT